MQDGSCHYQIKFDYLKGRKENASTVTIKIWKEMSELRSLFAEETANGDAVMFKFIKRKIFGGNAEGIGGLRDERRLERRNRCDKGNI